jgi:uncharacterized protein (DUF1800 family)
MASNLPPLEKLDPAESWQPWLPGAKDAWDRARAAHLYRRAAFGAGREELAEAERIGPAAALDRLLEGSPGADDLRDTLTDAGRIAAERDDFGQQLRGWWLYCMLQGGHPLREKMVLFWHGHFATSIAKVQDPALMFRQNCLLRDHALGKFGPLLRAISRDPAMLVWLDSNSNVKEHPNENYARELMELFSLGVGHYSEKDVREAARCFTGWHSRGNNFHFEAAAHDGGTKTVLGQTGDWDGDDVVRFVLGRPDAARFLVRKLYQYFISDNASPPDSFLEPLCDSFRQSDYDVRALIKTILASRHFYSEYAFRQRIKSPVEFVLGAVQSVYRRYDTGHPDYRPLPQQAFVSLPGAMGQILFEPPNVKGWPGGRAWLNTSTVLARDNFAEALTRGTLWGNLATAGAAFSASGAARLSAGPETSAAPSDEPVPPRAFDPARVLGEETAGSPEDLVRVLLDVYVPGGIRPAARAKLVEFVGEGNPGGSERDRRAREVVHAILTMPEYQLA